MIFPLSLKIIAGILILFVILFLALKKLRKLTGLLIIITLGIGVWQGLKEYNHKNNDPDNTPSKYETTSNGLLKEFENGDSATINKKYADQIISVSGLVKEIKKDTSIFAITLGDTTSSSVVQCEMKISYLKNAANLKKGSSVTIKGHFVSYQKGEEMLGILLGSTIYLNRCIIIANKNN